MSEIKVIPIVNSFYSSLTYIICRLDVPYVWIVDCGDSRTIIDWLVLNNKRIKGIIITHTHYDHIYGLNDIIEVFSDINIYVGNNGIKGLKSSKLNLSFYHGCEYICEYSRVKEVDNGEFIEIFPNACAEIYRYQGHDVSCIGIKFEDYLFTGDAYIPGLNVVTTFPKSDKIQAFESLLKIKSKIEEEKLRVMPGHKVG